MIYGNENWSPKEMLGVGPDFLTVRNWGLDAGSFFSSADIEANAKVCVIGHTLIKKLFRTTNPIGESIRVKQRADAGHRNPLRERRQHGR